MLNALITKAYVGAMTRIQKFVNSEKGDTNFISILIILGIVILLAGLFIGFKDKIVGQVENIINGFAIT